jgi:hypothetical protein
MRRSAEQTRLRILDAAYGLFWRQGISQSLDGRDRCERWHHQTSVTSRFICRSPEGY